MEVRSINVNLPLNVFIIGQESAANIKIKSQIVDQWFALDFSGSKFFTSLSDNCPYFIVNNTIQINAMANDHRPIYFIKKVSLQSDTKRRIESCEHKLRVGSVSERPLNLMFEMRWLNKLIILILLLGMLNTAYGDHPHWTINATNPKVLDFNLTPTFFIFSQICDYTLSIASCENNLKNQSAQIPISLYPYTTQGMYGGIQTKIDNYNSYATYSSAKDSVNNTRNSSYGNMYLRPGFLGYYVDEPDDPNSGRWKSLAQLLDEYNYIKSLDTTNHHLMYMTIMGNYSVGLNTYAPYTDVIGWDQYPKKPYWNLSGGYNGYDYDNFLYLWEEISNRCCFAAGNLQNLDNLNKPVFTWIQAIGTPTSGFEVLTPIETRANTYLAIIAGVKGVGFWSYAPGGITYKDSGYEKNATLRNYIPQLSKELHSINDVLVSQERAFAWYKNDNFTLVNFTNNDKEIFTWSKDNRLTPSKRPFAYRYYKTNDSSYYLIAVNRNASAKNTTITISDFIGFSGIARTVGLETSGSAANNTNHPIVNGQFTDIFDAYGAHVYEIISASNKYSCYDIDENGSVDTKDLGLIGQHFNEVLSFPYPRYDVNIDGLVDIHDITITGQHVEGV